MSQFHRHHDTVPERTTLLVIPHLGAYCPVQGINLNRFEPQLNRGRSISEPCAQVTFAATALGVSASRHSPRTATHNDLCMGVTYSVQSRLLQWFLNLCGEIIPAGRQSCLRH